MTEPLEEEKFKVVLLWNVKCILFAKFPVKDNKFWDGIFTRQGHINQVY